VQLRSGSQKKEGQFDYSKKIINSDKRLQTVNCKMYKTKQISRRLKGPCQHTSGDRSIEGCFLGCETNSTTVAVNLWLQFVLHLENAKCSCNKGEQTVDHIIYSCNLQEEERDRLKPMITRSEQWPVSKNKLVLKYHKNFKQFTDNIGLNKE